MNISVQRSPAHWDTAYQHGQQFRPVSDLEVYLFQTHVRTKPGVRVADIGCGTGPWTRTLAGMGMDVIGFDFSEVAIAKARTESEGKDNPRYSVWDANSDAVPANLAPRSFDIVTCRLSIAFFDRARFLTDVARWLTKDGVVHIVTPVHEKLAATEPHRGLNEQDIKLLGSGWQHVFTYNVVSDGSIRAVLLQHRV
ncbi:class I SAM-dependent methyltransferase [Streptomyces sp. WM6378]|uniref:class I SAM-dependent methyltransferase n=1 Tax=Streptomyces sp. WM6378 TaxID=1415557 RepID=UPI0006AF418C|nr:class I SAM-dependent methyltransferase [Streptomyces sp. WM6378]KOU53985.1 hypothetical protein ADK54_02785 [Streptomyces sp. WM6378]